MKGLKQFKLKINYMVIQLTQRPTMSCNLILSMLNHEDTGRRAHKKNQSFFVCLQQNMSQTSLQTPNLWVGSPRQNQALGLVECKGLNSVCTIQHAHTIKIFLNFSLNNACTFQCTHTHPPLSLSASLLPSLSIIQVLIVCSH